MAQANYDAVVAPGRQAFVAIYDKAVADRAAALDVVRSEIEEMDQRLANDAETLLKTMGDELEDAAPDPDLYDWPEPAEGDEDDDALYDSTRDYLDQVDIFRAYRGKEDDIGLAVDRVITKMCAFHGCGKPFTIKGGSLKQRYCSKSCNKRALRARGEEQAQP